jgi:hypothetical protein
VLQASLHEGIAGPDAAGRVRCQVHASPGPDIIRPMAPPSRRSSTCDASLVVAGSRETESFSAGRKARLKGYGPWENVELASVAGNTAVEAVWFWKVISHAQQLLYRLLSLVLPRYAQGPTSWYYDSESEPGWKAYLFVDEFAAQDPISSTKIRHALQKEAGREVIDGI